MAYKIMTSRPAEWHEVAVSPADQPPNDCHGFRQTITRLLHLDNELVGEQQIATDVNNGD